MVKKQEVKLLIAALICGVAGTAFVVASLATDYWVTATFETDNYVNYGLFFGMYGRSTGVQTNTYSLTMTCLMEHNVCAWSCQDTEEKRTKEVQELYLKGSTSFTCQKTSTRKKSTRAPQAEDSSKFVNAGMWVTTILFVCVSLVFGLIGCGFTILNILTNPIETYAGVFGLYIWFVCADVLVLIIWGAEFGIRLTNNIAINETISEVISSQGLAQLNWSYLLMVPAIIEHLMAPALVYYRQWRLNKVEDNTVIKMENQDTADILY